MQKKSKQTKMRSCEADLWLAAHHWGSRWQHCRKCRHCLLGERVDSYRPPFTRWNSPKKKGKKMIEFGLIEKLLFPQIISHTQQEWKSSFDSNHNPHTQIHGSKEDSYPNSKIQTYQNQSWSKLLAPHSIFMSVGEYQGGFISILAKFLFHFNSFP